MKRTAQRKPRTRKLKIHLPRAVAIRLDRIAVAHGITRVEVATQLLRRWITSHPKGGPTK